MDVTLNLKSVGQTRVKEGQGCNVQHFLSRSIYKGPKAGKTVAYSGNA